MGYLDQKKKVHSAKIDLHKMEWDIYIYIEDISHENDKVI
jgi:hypothetical protein